MPPHSVTSLLSNGFLLRSSLLTFITPSAPAVRGWMQWPIMGICPPSPSDIVGPLHSLSLHQTLNKGKVLPSLVLSSPSSPTPPPARIYCSFLWEPGLDSKKHQASPYSLTEYQQQYCPSLAMTKGKLEAMKTFQRFQKDLGLGMAMEAFQKVLSTVGADMYHDTMGCPDCWVHVDQEYCRCSCFNPQHDLHVCPESQACFCLNPKYSYDHFD